MDKVVKKLFPVAPIVSFISARKLSSYLGVSVIFIDKTDPTDLLTLS